MNLVIGILAHADAGKTTLSEQLLYQTGTIRTCGRVDHQNTFLDSRRLERERGITIFSDQAIFSWGDTTFYLLDTPGHVDFSAEMERSLAVLDCAIVAVSCVEGVQGHTQTIWRLLERKNLPVFLFLNKTDRAGADPAGVLKEIHAKLTPLVCDLTDGLTDSAMESAAEGSDDLFEAYLSGKTDEALWIPVMRRMVEQRALFPCIQGSALNGLGIEPLLSALCRLAPVPQQDPQAPFAGRVYKVRRDEKGRRLVSLKVISGTLCSKALIGEEKINELLISQGSKLFPIQEAPAGTLCTVSGLASVQPGDGLGALEDRLSPVMAPALTSQVLFDANTSAKTVLERFRILEDEDPLLGVRWEEALQEVRVNVMGPIQLEVLAQQAKERFHLNLSFGDCQVLYLETIEEPVVGYGHFEPLRHYAEVHLRLEPGPRGSGVTFSSACSTDVLTQNWQRLVETHVFEKQHRGILTGSPLTDVRITLLTGRAHLKHTEGGDFREAVYRAIRQGLEQARSLLLEPVYRFSIHVSSDLTGRVLSDIQRMNGSFSAPELLADGAVLILGRAPVSTMMNYSRDLAALSKGSGSLNLQPDGYQPCHNPDEVLEGTVRMFKCLCKGMVNLSSIFFSFPLKLFLQFSSAVSFYSKMNLFKTSFVVEARRDPSLRPSSLRFHDQTHCACRKKQRHHDAGRPPPLL